MKSLTQIGREEFTEKVTHGFLDIYENLWKDLQNEPITLLEIGIYNGNSLITWDKWFPSARIIGIDKYAQPLRVDSRAERYYGDQADKEFLNSIILKSPQGFDIIIDDGGHHWHEQQISFEILWPAVKSGGMYIIEDLHTSADKYWIGNAEIDTVEYLTKFVYPLAIGTPIKDIYSISFYSKLAVLIKK